MFRSRLYRWGFAMTLAALSGSAFSVTYEWNNAYSTESASCMSVALADTLRLQNIGYDHLATTAGHPFIAWTVKTVSGYARNVGDVCSYVLVMTNGASATTDLPRSAALTQIAPDALQDDLSAMPVQRVLTYIGWMLMLGIGVVAGQQR